MFNEGNGHILIEDISRIINSILSKIKFSSFVYDREDLFQEAWVRVLQKSKNFDEGRGVKYTTYIWRVAWSAVIDCLNKVKNERYQYSFDKIDIVYRRDYDREIDWKGFWMSLSENAREVLVDGLGNDKIYLEDYDFDIVKEILLKFSFYFQVPSSFLEGMK